MSIQHKPTTQGTQSPCWLLLHDYILGLYKLNLYSTENERHESVFCYFEPPIILRTITRISNNNVNVHLYSVHSLHIKKNILVVLFPHHLGGFNVCSILCDHTTSCEAYSFMTDGYRIFTMCTNLGACHTHKEGYGTSKSAQLQELTWRDFPSPCPTRRSNEPRVFESEFWQWHSRTMSPVNVHINNKESLYSAPPSTLSGGTRHFTETQTTTHTM